MDGEEAPAPERLLKGVMRVGFYSKQLLLASDKHIDAVVICSKIPTVKLLKEVAELFNKLVEKSDAETVGVEENPEKSALVVSLSGVDVTCHVTLTSPVLREGESAPAGEGGAAPPTDVEKPADALPVEPCLKALAELRHAKWYQVKCVPLQIVTPTLRVLRDVQSRVTKWSSMSSWAMELFVEKVLASVGRLISPGDSMRRVFEALASGYLIDRGNQLVDPCEKDVVDALANLSIQDREDITASAQHAVRLMSFNQIYKVLGTERELAELPVAQNGDRKRHRDATSLDDDCSDAKKEKKDSADTREKTASPTNVVVKAEQQ
ncbi:DZF family protein [Aphelenchoides avenae]|nr:DZF family protein [Aphelenchus avenae]